MLTILVPRYQLSLRGGLERASWGVGSEFGIFSGGKRCGRSVGGAVGPHLLSPNPFRN